MKFAAIDIGSNAARMVIVRVWRNDDAVKRHQIEFVRFALRLGDEAFLEKRLSPAKQGQLEKLVHVYRLLMDLHQVDDYRAYATSSLREAENGPEIIQALKEKFDVDVRVISGAQEADLIFKAHKYLLEDLDRFLFIDVGGGSTELTLFLGPHLPTISHSFDLGTVRILDGIVDANVWENMAEWIKRNVLADAEMVAVGTGGNINKVHALAGNRDNDRYLSSKTLEEIAGKLKRMPLQDRIDKLGLNPDRADVIVPATEIYQFVMRQAKLKKMFVSGVSLRDGMIEELAEMHADQL